MTIHIVIAQIGLCSTNMSLLWNYSPTFTASFFSLSTGKGLIYWLAMNVARVIVCLWWFFTFNNFLLTLLLHPMGLAWSIVSLLVKLCLCLSFVCTEYSFVINVLQGKLPVRRQSPIQAVTRPGVEPTTFRSWVQCPNRYATKPP